MSEINVIKRDGSREPYNLKKVDRVLRWAAKGIKNVDTQTVLQHFQFNYSNNGITTKQIHEGLIDSALNLITVDTPNYQFIAGRLLNYWLRKQVWGGKNSPRLIDHIKANIKRGFYDPKILEKYSTRDINKINEMIDHDKDLNFTHCGISQVIKKYLVQNRETKEVVETPQFAYALIAMTLFENEPKNRLQWVRDAYNMFSDHIINLATPVLAGARTPLRSYASCALFDVNDSMDSICAHDYLFKKASASRYGLGFNVSRMRPVNAKIRNGDVLHTGLVPYLKSYESGIKACHQNGLRGASATVTINFWHYQIEDVVVLKNNMLPEERAVRFLDYCVSICDLFMERVKNNEDITLFNPHEVPELLEKYGTPEWNELYIKREQNCEGLMVKKISARKLMGMIAKERLETGRIYIFNVDNVNRYGVFNDPVHQTNLCVEVTHPLIGSNTWNDAESLIGVCILAAINPKKVKTEEEFELGCRVAVRMLDNLIDIQEYFDIGAENFAKKFRSLGIGMLNFAAELAGNKIKYTDEEAPNFAAELAEKLSFYCIKASIELAKERGKFEYFDRTKWKDGSLPIDRYAKAIDEFITAPLKYDWEGLRGQLLEHGIRNSTLLAFMPVESSSVVSGSTAALEPIRDYIISKISRAGKEIVVAPDLETNKEYYTLAFDMKNNDALLKIYAGINKFTCMSISANTYTNVNHYDNRQIPLSVIVDTIVKASRWGLKTLYYNNTEDAASSTAEEACAGGSCAL